MLCPLRMGCIPRASTMKAVAIPIIATAYTAHSSVRTPLLCTVRRTPTRLLEETSIHRILALLGIREPEIV